ncbi:MAG: acyltransferase [Verrucomicrobiae bacterium]|nr:acyltransferase [Verrucomicrobiae bacterium]
MSDISRAKSSWWLPARLAVVGGGTRDGTETSCHNATGAPDRASVPLVTAAGGTPIVSDGCPPRTGSANLLPGLELIRGLACLQVFLSHIFVVLMLHSRAQVNPAFWKLAVLDWSYQSVMVFFVLSGLVIALSQQRKQQDFSAFMRSRFRRLEPLYLVAVVFSFALEGYFYPAPTDSMLVGHLLYIQGSYLAPVFNVNAPLWSLAYEFLFYFIFACTIGSYQKILHRVWFVLGLGAMALNLAGFGAPGMLGFVQNILSLSPVWLLGTFLTDPYFCGRANLAQRFMLFGMLPLATRSLPFLGFSNSPAHSLIMALLVAPLIHAAAQSDPVRSKFRPLIWGVLIGLYFTFTASFLMSNQGQHHRTEMIFAVLAPFLFYGLVPLYRLLCRDAMFFTPRVTRFSLWLGKMSYAIYIIHFPVLIALGAATKNPLLQVAADICLVIPLAWLLTFYVEPVMVVAFDRLWPASRKPIADVKPAFR